MNVAAKPMIVLVVEDEVLVNLNIAEALRDLGLKTVQAYTAEEALKVLSARGDISVVKRPAKFKTQSGASRTLFAASDGLMLAKSNLSYVDEITPSSEDRRTNKRRRFWVDLRSGKEKRQIGERRSKSDRRDGGDRRADGLFQSSEIS